MDGKEFLKQDYPGRGVIVGYDGFNSYSVYFVMGRRPSSQARLLEKEGNLIFTRPIDRKILEEGDPELLLYNAIATKELFIVASNGRQTDTIFTEYACNDDLIDIKNSKDTVNFFTKSLSQWKYEPDASSTPRIAGFVTPYSALLGIIKKGEKGVVREVFKVQPNTLSGITTYSGENKDPLPSYEGEPFTLELPATFNTKDLYNETAEDLANKIKHLSNKTAEDLANKIWGLLNPDFRVSLVTLISSFNIIGGVSYFIINRDEVVS